MIGLGTGSLVSGGDLLVTGFVLRRQRHIIATSIRSPVFTGSFIAFPGVLVEYCNGWASFEFGVLGPPKISLGEVRHKVERQGSFDRNPIHIK